MKRILTLGMKVAASAGLIYLIFHWGLLGVAVCPLPLYKLWS